MQIRTILVPTDFSDSATRAIDTAVEFAKVFSAEIVLLHAYHVDIPYATVGFGGGVVVPDGFYEQVRDAARTGIEEAAAAITARGVQATGRAVPGPASSAILEEAANLKADMIVMGTRGLSGIKHVLLGSVAERTVRLATCPVLTVREDE